MINEKTKEALFERLNVNAYRLYDFDVPYYLVQGIATYLVNPEAEWKDVLYLIRIAEEDKRITSDAAQFLKERFKRKKNGI